MIDFFRYQRRNCSVILNVFERTNKSFLNNPVTPNTTTSHPSLSINSSSSTPPLEPNPTLPQLQQFASHPSLSTDRLHPTPPLNTNSLPSPDKMIQKSCPKNGPKNGPKMVQKMVRKQRKSTETFYS